MAFDADPAGFALVWREEQEKLAARIVVAQERLLAIAIDDAVLNRIVAITAALELDGHRADIVMAKAARALGAYRGLNEIGVAENPGRRALRLGPPPAPPALRG